MLGNEPVAGLKESGRRVRSAPQQKQPALLPGETGYLEDVLLRTVEEEDDSVMKRSGLVGQRVEDLQHDGAAHGVVAGPCGERERVKDNKDDDFLFTKVAGWFWGIPNHKYKALNNSITAL